jgi:spore germination protein YaaH
MEIHKQEILDIIDQNDFDGIDLDYESIELKNKDIFLQFIKELSEELDKKDKVLSVTVLSQWGDNITYPSLIETRQVQDWSIIGKYADEVRIMTYDFTSPNDAEPGPIAPIIWMEEVLKYALTKIPKEKIWLGIHLYSYEWVMDQSNERIKTNSYTYDFVSSEVLTDPTIVNSFDNLTDEGIAQYPCSEEYKCILYYQDPEGVKAREELANKYQIAGVAYWRLGGEGNLLTSD